MLSPDGCVARDGGPGGADTLFSVTVEGGMEEPSPGADNLAKGEKLLQTPPSLHKGGLARSPPGCTRGRFVAGDAQAAASMSREAENGAGKASR